MADRPTEVLGIEVKAGEGIPPKNDAQEGAAPDDHQENPLEALVGEGKKYASVEELAKGTLHLTKHLDTIMNEKADLEDKLTRQQTSDQMLSEIFAKLDGLDAGGDPNDPDDPTPNQPEHPDNDDGPITVTKVRDLLQTMLTEQDQKKQEQAKIEAIKANQAKTLAGLEKALGSPDAAKAALAEYVGEDQGRADVLNRMASYDPEGAVEFVVQRTKKEGVSFGDGKTRHVGGEDNASGLTWVKARQIRREDPEYYESREFQNQLMQARLTNPRFWDGTKRA